MAGLKRNRFTLGVCLVLGLLTFALYWPATQHKFVNFDDPLYVTENSRVQSGLSWAGVIWAFTTRHACNWHPLTWISHMIDCQLYGLNPGGHHLSNVLFHIANSMLLYVLLTWMTGRGWRSACVAALFAWHPLHVESVAWIAERKDVLSTFFWILTLMAYVQYVKKPSRSRYLAVLLLFAFGLMSKPMVVTLPFVLLLLDYWPFGRFVSFRGAAQMNLSAFPEQSHSTASAVVSGSDESVAHLVREKLPFFALALAAGIVTFWIQSAAGAVSPLNVIPLPSRIANALLVYWGYISKTLWPVDLAPVYPYPGHWPIGWVIGSALALLTISSWFVLRARKNPWLIVGWLWYLGTLVPVIGLVQVGSQSMADRYMYIPSIGLFIVMVWGLSDLLESRPRKRELLGVLGAASLAGCLFITRLQLGNWQDGERLFRHALRVTTNNYIAYGCLGKALEDQGRRDEALFLYQESVRLEPDLPDGQYNLGTALMKEGKLEEAVGHLRIAVNGNPKVASAQNNLGNALLKLGRLDEAAAHLGKAVLLDPDDAEIHYNLGTVLLTQSKVSDAIVQFTQALQLKPDYEQAHANLAVALIREGRVGEAVPHFSEAVRLDPNNAAMRFNLGLALMEQNKPKEAAVQFSEVLRLRPDDAATHYRLAVALARERETREAILHYQQALRLQPDFPDALNDLAGILSSDPDPKLRSGREAIQLAKRACELTKYQQADLVATLAAAYAEDSRFAEAVSTAQRAREIALAADQQEMAAKTEELLKLFQSRRPYREAF